MQGGEMGHWHHIIVVVIIIVWNVNIVVVKVWITQLLSGCRISG